MSTEYPKISIRLQELINQANNSFPSTGEAIMAAYNQALEEGYTPRQAKKMLYDNVVFLNERTIRRHLSLEARDTEKIRTGINNVDNGPQKSAEKDPLLNNQGSDQVDVTTGTNCSEENTAPNSSHKNILSSAITIMKLENILKNKDKYIMELLERNEALNNENWKLKEEKQTHIDTQSGGVLKVKVEVSLLYTGLFMVRNLNASQAIIHISNGEYVKLEPV
jgi:hypothetical protein